MAKVIPGRQMADGDVDVVVFLIGFRINKYWKVWVWIPIMISMTRMIFELFRTPELGLLGARTHFGIRNTMLVQYWESFEKLEAYAQAKDREHLPVWQNFRRKIEKTRDAGIWHETFILPRGSYETMYVNMPAYGMNQALASRDVVDGNQSARERLGSNHVKKG